MTIQTMRDFGIGEGQLFIGGRWVDSASRERREIENPKDQSIVATVASSTIEDADRAIAAARKAQPLWRRTTAAQRAALLNRFAALIDENAETLAQLLTAEGGKILRDSRIDVAFSALLLRYAAESARHIQGEIMPGENPDEQIWIQRVPYGVAVGITAWNFPAALFARKVGPALVTGNTIIIKPHEQTPLATLVLAELSRRAGIPEGVINVIVGDGRTVGAHLVAHKGTDIISMTGSVRAGGEIYALGAEHIKPVRLELGGKAPFIVMEDADIDEAVEAAVASKFFAGGAVCTCNDRMYLHRAIHDEFMEKFIARVQKLTVGDPTTAVDIGPRINASEVTKLKSMVEQALKQNAAKLVDGTPLKAEARGHWFYPTILSVDSNDLDIMKQETFGPVIAALAVDDFEQALAYANDSDFGLSAYVFTRDHRRIMRSVNELEFGEIYLNRASGESPHAHHVGYRKSGIGGEDGKHGIEGYLRKKTLYNNYA